VPERVVETATVEPRLTAVVAERTTWEDFPRLWPRLLDEVYRFVRPRPELGGPAPGERWQNVMLYKDDAPNVEVGVLVGSSFAGEGRVVVSQLPGGRVVRTVLRDGYAALPSAHEAVHRFVAQSGLELAGPRWEVYGHPDGERDPDVEIVYLRR
jgi:effector-binding domain-containing protein